MVNKIKRNLYEKIWDHNAVVSYFQPQQQQSLHRKQKINIQVLTNNISVCINHGRDTLVRLEVIKMLSTDEIENYIVASYMFTLVKSYWFCDNNITWLWEHDQ